MVNNRCCIRHLAVLVLQVMSWSGFNTSFAFRGLAAVTNARNLRQQHIPLRCFSSAPDDVKYEEPWTIYLDKLLWNHRHEELPVQASLVQRGFSSVTKRMQELQSSSDLTSKESTFSSIKHVLDRIHWDPTLDETQFKVLHRVDDDRVIESPLTADSMDRIVAIHYRDRLVWDRSTRVDDVLAGEGIVSVVRGYDAWKTEHDKAASLLQQRQVRVGEQIKETLGEKQYFAFLALSDEILEGAKDSRPSFPEAEAYAESSLVLLRETVSTDDSEALDLLSEHVALLPNSTAALRQVLLSAVSAKGTTTTTQRSRAKLPKQLHPLPELPEDDLTESFIRGTGPGGQKINKTSNRVMLVHNPTHLCVECQETRSLHQNRKIARKRLRQKLDEYYNGNQSRSKVKAQHAATKKSKARNRARRRQKQREGE